MKKLWKLLILTAIFAMVLAACGGEETAETPTAEAPTTASEESAAVGLESWTLDAAPWSSYNGAAIDLTAVPTAYADGMTANFVVRLEGEDISNNPCEWNGSAFTSYADLNAEDGYCYYLLITRTDGTETTVELNTPTNVFDETLINLSASLESFCTAAITDSAYAEDWLTITQGTAQVQVPMIGDSITCHSAELYLNLDGTLQSKQGLNDKLVPGENGTYTVDLSGIKFSVPQIEGDHQLSLTLYAYLSDDTTLVDENCASWFYSDGTVDLTVG